MKKILLITISLSIAYWGVLLAVEYAWTLPIPFLVIVFIWYCFLTPKYKLVCKNERYGILRTSDKNMIGINYNDSWWLDEDMQDKFCYTSDKEKAEIYLEQLNSN